MAYVLVAIFGAAGALARFSIDRWISNSSHGDFPWGTFVINVGGAFAIGVLVALTTERLGVSPNWRTALGVGFLGAFTTFSTYAYETVRLAEDGALGLAFVYAVGMVALGLFACVLGLALGRAL